MKKIIAMILSLSMLLVACGSDEPAAETTYDVNEVLTAITDVTEIANETVVDDMYMDFIGLTEDIVKSYAGVFCSVTPGVDIALVVEAQDGKLEDVKAAMQENLDYIYSSNENYPGPLRDKAEAGKIVSEGNIVILVIAGDVAVVESEGVEAAYAPIDTAIEEFFKK